ncbi:MAG TPA: hypothetical protein VK771_07780 [Acidimicrobiia bacterium]|nr:hypothetical protein [Acidimicrobiia bacterium]
MAVSLSLFCAAVTALSYGVGSVMQASAARRAEMRPNLDVMLLVRLVRDPTYVVSLALDLVGFVASVVALRRLPLFMVQSAVASSVGVTAVVASFAFGLRLRRYERGALVGLLVGFAFLAVSARPGRATSAGHAEHWLLVLGVAIVVVIGVLSARIDSPKAGAGLALGAGLSFAGTGIAAREFELSHLSWHLVVDPNALSLASYGVLGALLFATALQRSSVTSVAALVFLVETVVPSAIGLCFLGDRARPHLAVAAAAGFVLTVGASVALARRAEPLPREPRSSG